MRETKASRLREIIERHVHDALNEWIADSPNTRYGYAQHRREIEAMIGNRISRTYSMLEIQDCMDWKKRSSDD